MVREALFHNSPHQGSDDFNMTHPLFQWIATLNNFRRLYPALTLGSHVNQWNTPGGPGLFAYSRVLNTEELFVVFNTAGTNMSLPSRTLTYPPERVLVNLLNTNETITLNSSSQTPAITVSPQPQRFSSPNHSGNRLIRW